MSDLRSPFTPPPVNPYAPPKAKISLGSLATEDAERVRRELLKHEASIRSIGSLYWFSAVFMGFATIMFLIFSATGEMGEGFENGPLMTLVYAFLTLVFWALGRGLRNLEAGIRGWVTVLAVLGLLGFPLGTLFNAYVLYLLHSEKGKRIMTPEYQQVVRETPHIKYKTPLWLVILLLLIIGFFVFIIVMATMS